MNESIRNMKKGQKVRLLTDWIREQLEKDATYGAKGDIFTVERDQMYPDSISLINPRNNKRFLWSLNWRPIWERCTEKEFTDEEYEELLV